MHRDKWTEKLVRVLDTVAAGQLPAPVKAVYVFGSYARGALNPNDLDLVVLYENPGKKYWQALDEECRAAEKDPIRDGWRMFQTRMRGSLRRPGERVDIFLAQSVSEVTGTGSKIKESDLILLWTPQDQDFRSKLDAIRADAEAGQAPRDHLVNIRRLRDTITSMDATMQMLADSELVLSRIPISSITHDLNSYHQKWLAHWQKCHVMGECLIPHIRANEPNDLLAFERGPNWMSPARPR